MYICTYVDLNINNGAYKPHTTLVYDERNIDFGLPKFESCTGVIVGVDYLGENKEHLVLIVESEDLVKYHKRLLDMGYRHSYKDFIPHITYMYDVKENKQMHEFSASLMIGRIVKYNEVEKSKIT